MVKNYQKLNWWVYRISEPSTVSKRVFLLRLPAASIMCIKICLCYLDKTWAENYGKKRYLAKIDTSFERYKSQTYVKTSTFENSQEIDVSNNSAASCEHCAICLSANCLAAFS